MAKKEAKYTLWTIPKSEWSQPMQDFEAAETTSEEVIGFAKQLHRKRLDVRVRPLDTPVTQDGVDETSNRE